MKPITVSELPDFHRKNVPCLKLCCDVTLYWTGSMFDHAEGILDFYNESIALVGSKIRFFETETMGDASEVTNETFDLVPFWLSDRHSRRSFYAIFMEGGAEPNLPSDHAFILRMREGEEVSVGVVRVVLPWSVAADNSSVLTELVQRLARRLNFHSGHAGLAINWNETGDHLLDAQEIMFAVSQRYLGIDLSELVATMSAIPDGIKCVNWLTLLGTEYVNRLGGTAALRHKLGQDIPVFELFGGALIQAGSHPGIGDVNRGQLLPMYHRVGATLVGIRSRTHAPFLLHGEDIYDEELTEAWLGRFDREVLETGR